MTRSKTLFVLLVLLLTPARAWSQGQLFNTNITLAGTLNAGTATGSVNAYVLTLNPPITAYVTNQCYVFKANTTNTGIATLNINGLGPKTLKRFVNAVMSDLGGNEIANGQPVLTCYDGTFMQLVGSGGGGGGIAGIIVEEVDGAPTGTFTKIKFTNGSVANNGDGSATVTTGAGGGGDASTNTSTSIDGEVPLFSGTGGKTFRRSTLTGLSKLTAGVQSIATPGTDYVIPGGNVATATALAANGANCALPNFPLGTDTLGASENCTPLPTSISGTTNEITASAATGPVVLSLAPVVNLAGHTLRLPNSTALPPTCTVGDAYMDTDATSGARLYLCEVGNTWVPQGTGGGGGGAVSPFLSFMAAASAMTNFGGL